MNTLFYPAVQPQHGALELLLWAWILGFAACVLIEYGFGIKGSTKWYLKASRNLITAPFRSLWKNHNELIIGIIIGVTIGALATLYILNNYPNPYLGR